MKVVTLRFVGTTKESLICMCRNFWTIAGTILLVCGVFLHALYVESSTHKSLLWSSEHVSSP
jgi:hypothetical protein